MKYFQSYKVYQCVYTKREKIAIQQSMRKQKLSKSYTLFYLASCFMEPLKIAINHIFFNRSFCSQDVFLFRRFAHSAIFIF